MAIPLRIHPLLFRAAVLCTAVVPLIARAAEDAQAPGVSLSMMLQTVIGLVLILGVFIAAAWLMRRMNGGRGFLGSEGSMRVIGGIPVGTRERIVLVEIEDTWLVIGIAPGQMRTLHVLPKGAAPTPTSGGETQFGQWLRQFKDTRRETGK